MKTLERIQLAEFLGPNLKTQPTSLLKMPVSVLEKHFVTLGPQATALSPKTAIPAAPKTSNFSQIRKKQISNGIPVRPMEPNLIMPMALAADSLMKMTKKILTPNGNSHSSSRTISFLP
jgi:hypothetical protein